MEENRLKPMPQNYRPELFAQIYSDVKSLKNKLASSISPEYFQVESGDIKSWFDVKLLYVFTKYHGKVSDDALKGHVINSLRLFKKRVLINAYQQKNEAFRNKADIDEMLTLKAEESNKEQGELLGVALEYFEANLSSDAYNLLLIELYPPIFILKKMKGKKKIGKIPSQMIIEYLGWTNDGASHKYISQLRKEIRLCTEQAKVDLNSPEFV